MNRWWILGWAVMLGVSVAACDGGDDGDEDAGPDDGEDSGMMMMGEDAGPEMGPAVGSGAMLDALDPADYACRGSVMAPADDGADVSFTAVAEVFGSDPTAFAEGLTVQFYPGNVPASDCTGDCQEVTTDSSGEADVTDAAESWYAYRIVGGEGLVSGAPQDFITTLQVNEQAPAAAGESVTLTAVPESLRNTIITLLGVTQEEGTATITGTVVDCAGDSIANATVRVFADGSEVDLGGPGTRNGPREFYFNGEQFPRGAQEATHVDGLYGAANVPVPASGEVRVEIWGSLTEGGAAEMLGCETVPVAEDGISIVNVGPTRSDGPADCSG
ncbi:MAG TPA: hypothetical protein RMH99_11815 [Sandaracinaceae bacterium LLY-WYZ-13_1]|nr:hypothetical protein [Sandaracinaceae bacterium LLY-WYZ-13_1]